MEKAQKILLVGATGGTGRATIDALVKRGHRVTAFSRHAESLENELGPGDAAERRRDQAGRRGRARWRGTTR